ncbi:hypothetical protein BD408DRAFT_262584 [Parasitella parasitica]|nr:hypothetical protein BD408DRAFT_262584 [Parasitella parasitica]
MSDNDGELKRSQEPVEIVSTVEHKKRKTNNDQQTQKQVPLLPTTLVLDKVQEETINDLVKNSNAAASLLQRSTETTNTPGNSAETKDSSDTVATETPSADATKAVTALSGNEKTEEISLSITSEQLLFALTSVPSSEKEAEEQQEKSTKENIDANQIKSITDNSTTIMEVANAPPVPQPKVTSPPAVPTSTPSNLGISPKNILRPSEVSVASTTPNPAVSESAIAPIITTATTASISPSALPQTSRTNDNAKTSASIPTTLRKANISNNNNTSSTANSPSLSTSATASASSLAFSNLPDISAALRRLSSTNPSVIEQLSSSPRLSSHLNDRKGSSVEASPSEILGNALAAVAANAAARSNSNNLIASPKQQQQNVTSSTSSAATLNNNTNYGGNSNNTQTTATATATAIAKRIHKNLQLQ